MTDFTEQLQYNNQINFLGFRTPEKLIDIMCDSTMYVHTAYIENDMAKVAAEDAWMKVRTNLAEYLEKGIVK